MDVITTGLNAAQRAAVTSDAAVLQVLAPPGSGKTKTLTARVAALLTQGIPPWSIIVCTFTVKAAKEMAERIEAFVGQEVRNKLRIGTFHGVSLRYLRQYKDLAGLNDRVGVADTSDTQVILKRIIKQQDANLDPHAAGNRISSHKSKGIDLDQHIASLKTLGEQREFVEIWREYQQTLKTDNLLDYDDILLKCVALLKAHPECVANINTVLVDEFQDTNGLQFQLMSLFAQKRNRITIVGDPDQSIYGWRSAEIKNLSHMRDIWPHTITINLEENYRSSGAILHAAQQLIEQDQARPPKKLQATHSVGLAPTLRQLPTAKDEAEWIATEIKRLQALTGEMLENNDFAILVRTAALSRVVEAAFGKSGIPYRMVGGMKFFERVEIKLILDYLRVINQPTHSEALARILNVPARRIGDKTVEDLRAQAHKKNRTLWSLLVSISQSSAHAYVKVSAPVQKNITEFVRLILAGQRKLAKGDTTVQSLILFISEGIGLKAYLKSKYPDNHEGRFANVEELMAQAAEISELPFEPESNQEGQSSSASSEAPGTAASALTAFLANASLAAAVDEKKEEGQPASVVTISTIHAAKGLEWPVVFIPACYDGSIPHSRSENTDEERRLLYVGMTRAKAGLYLSCPVEDSRKQATAMSCFLDNELTKRFTPRGPSIRRSDVQNLCIVLDRELPSEDEIRATASLIERDEDDYWPDDGSNPVGTIPHSAFGCRPMLDGQNAVASGFSSVRSQYDTLTQSNRKEEERFANKRRKVDQETKKPGHGSLEGFLQPDPGKQKNVEMLPTLLSKQNSLNSSAPKSTVYQGFSTSMSNDKPAYTIRASALHKKRKTVEGESPYCFLSSSPTRPEEDQENKQNPNTDSSCKDESLKPVMTLHQTSMQMHRRPGKVLGMRRSINGWSARKGQK